MYTVETVKEIMPEVPLLWDKKVYSARISGRNNRFATVWVTIAGSSVDFEFAWETIAHCLNSSKPLRV